MNRRLRIGQRIFRQILANSHFDALRLYLYKKEMEKSLAKLLVPEHILEHFEYDHC